jgi:hypothetical protein
MNAWDLFRKSIRVWKRIRREYDLDNENEDYLPDAPRNYEFMSDYEKDNAMWESYCESHKGSKVDELIKTSQVFEHLKCRWKNPSSISLKYQADISL